jgi:hypothetical protein
MSMKRTATPRRRISFAAVTAVVLTALATSNACSDDDDAAAASETLHRSTWISEVNARCAAHNAALGEIIGPLFASGPPNAHDAQAALDDIVARTRQVTADIDALAEPSALTIHVETLVRALDSGSDRAEELGGEAFFATDEDPFRRAGDIASELGLVACDTEN